MALRALIFDMDGVLFDTERLAAETWVEAGLSLGHALPEALIKGAIGLDHGLSRAYYQKAFAGQFPYEQVEQRRNELFRAHIRTRGVPVKPGVQRILKEAGRLGLGLALGTSSRAVYTHAMLWLAGIDSHFQVIVTRDLVQAAKPAPDTYRKAAALLGVDPGECLVFEDSGHGIQAAQAAGMRVIMVPDLIEASPDLRARCLEVCSSLGEAAERLERLMVVE